ncbi:MAG: glycosyltransferase [Dongiaceae bacterium]
MGDEPPTHAEAPDLAALRLLEVGDRCVFKRAMPDRTELLWTGARHWPEAGLAYRSFGPGGIAPLRQALQGGVDLVICHAPHYAPLGLRWMLRQAGQSPLAFPATLLRGSAPLFLRRPGRVPLIVLDTEDSPGIARHNFALLDRCRLYFKRELPADLWRAFYRTGHPLLPTPRLRRSPRWRARIGKLRPLSLGLPLESEALLPAAPPDKTVDLFFAGTLEANSTVRERGRAALSALAAEGLRVDLATERLPRAEFLARMARAWLTWSPEGLGWDCFRHYEAAACWSVPLLNPPPLLRHAPLRAGEHCLHYEIEGDGLARAVRAALQDKPRLARIAAAARAHVLRHHTQAALCAHVLLSCLAPAEDSR